MMTLTFAADDISECRDRRWATSDFGLIFSDSLLHIRPIVPFFARIVEKWCEKTYRTPENDSFRHFVLYSFQKPVP